MLAAIVGLLLLAPGLAWAGPWASAAPPTRSTAAVAARGSGDLEGPTAELPPAPLGSAPVEGSALVSADAVPEARVAEARVWLTIHRGGETLPTGERVDRNGAWVEGTIEYRLTAPAVAGQRLVLLDFAEAIHRDPVELDEVRIATHLDGPFDRGALVLTGLWGVEASERVGDRRDVVLTLAPGAEVVTLRYTVDVPHRYWPFGCVRRRCSLSGALAPLPSVPAQGGRWLPKGRVIDPVRWRVEDLRLAVPGRVKAGRVVAPPRREPQDEGLLGRSEELVVVADEDRRQQFPSVFWGPRWHRTHTIHRGVRIEVLHVGPRPLGQVPHETLIQLRRDVAGQVQQIAVDAVELLAALAQPLPPDETITVVQGPLRHTVAQAHPDVVVLSDQALELLPSDRLLKFHQTAIARSVFDMLLERRFRGTHDPSVDLWLPGILSFSIVQLWEQTREHADEFAADILRNFTFVPAVDRFLYTQQASFSASYFRGVEDEISLRDHPLWFSHELPTGRRLFEKLRDSAGDEAVEGLVRAMVHDPTQDPVRAAERAWGHELGWFFEQWLGPYPSVDYVLHRVVSEREGDGWRHEITVERIGQRPVIEPVQVLATERGGEAHYLVWDGELAPHNESLATEPRQGLHRWELHTARRLRSVRVDPRSRLLQQPQPPHDNVDPRFDDRRPPQYRFLYTGAGVSIAASEFVNATTPASRFNAIAGFASFETSLRRDLRRTGHLLVSRDRETNLGLGASVNLWFGDKVNNQRRRSRVRLSLNGSWLNESSLDPRGGVRMTERVALVDDTRRFGWWPERGRWLSVSLTGRHTVRIDGLPGDVHDVVAGASWIQLWRLAHDHVLATALSGEMVFPLVGGSEFRNLARMGGIGGLSGYLADEIFGRGVVLAQAEYRHVYVNDLHLPLLHLGYLRSLGGTLFTGTGSASSCDGFDGWLGPKSFYGHAGYAADARLSIFGVTPQLFRVEVSVPLVRRDTTCLGQSLPGYLGERQGLSPEEVRQVLPRFNINVTFQQTF
ncbi:MAG: hypothetical protein H6712_03385 [Myxococcales bacterium]|nr:hypothetical protein [Myxococcales bacterium]